LDRSTQSLRDKRPDHGRLAVVVVRHHTRLLFCWSSNEGLSVRMHAIAGANNCAFRCRSEAAA
jgi:hypothetical protein